MNTEHGAVVNTPAQIRRKRRKSNFTPISNKLLQDRRLSCDTLAVIVAVLSRPDDWNVSVTWLQTERDMGRDRVRAAINQAVEFGYCVRSRERMPDNTFKPVVYEFTDEPGEANTDFQENTPEPRTGFQALEKPPPEKRPSTKDNKDTNTNRQNPQPPKRGASPLTIHPGYDSQVQLSSGKVVLLNGCRAEWEQRLGREQLDLALIEIAAEIQENSRTPIEAQVMRKLARMARDKADRDQRYSRAADANKPAPARLSRWGV